MQKYQKLEKIITNLSVLRFIVHSKVKLGHYDINKHLENFYGNILNLILNIKLEPTNTKIKNYPAIDLYDNNSRVCVQVTSQKTICKIRKTINLFEKSNMNVDFDTLYILNILSKSTHSATIHSSKITFEMDKHIIDVDDLIDLIESTENSVLESICSYVESEIGYYISRFLNPNYLQNLPNYCGGKGANYNTFLTFNGINPITQIEVVEINKIFDSLGNKSKKSRISLFVILRWGNYDFSEIKLNIHKASEILTDSHGFNKHDCLATLSDMKDYYYRDECTDPALEQLVLFENNILEYIKTFTVGKDNLLYSIIVERNFTLLD